MSDTEQSVHPPVASAITLPRLVAIVVLVFGMAALAVRCVAVSSSQSAIGHTGHAGGIPARAGPPLSIEQLAAKAGCTPTIQTNVADLRQGYCPTSSGGRYFVTTFTTGAGQQQWLEQALDYGALLVGNRWAVGADPRTLRQLQAKLGGDIVNHAHGH